MKRIYFSHWGNTKHLKIPAYGVSRAGDLDPVNAVARAVGRANGLIAIAVSDQGYCPPDREYHYEITLGTRCPTGGYNVEATLWVSIKRKED